MNTAQYIAALKRLGLTPHSMRTAAALGMSRSGIQKIVIRKTVRVPGPIERLLAMYVKHGLPAEYQG